jgi:hypothetical protein
MGKVRNEVVPLTKPGMISAMHLDSRYLNYPVVLQLILTISRGMFADDLLSVL